MPNWTAVAGYLGGTCSVACNLAVDLKPIRVNAVSPGLVKTPLWNILMSGGARKDMPVFRSEKSNEKNRSAGRSGRGLSISDEGYEHYRADSEYGFGCFTCLNMFKYISITPLEKKIHHLEYMQDTYCKHLTQLLVHWLPGTRMSRNLGYQRHLGDVQHQESSSIP